MQRPCHICGDADAFGICTTCRDEAAKAQQATAAAAGMQAYRAGRPVIFIHGRPYADPAADAPETGQESPFPWGLWDDGRP